ncbi:MAG: DcrB-related protein [Candidatus Micrarchaeota archaeon]|nr:DcrB-related protein [Candidatus Micrarchaeota archaeon]
MKAEAICMIVLSMLLFGCPCPSPFCSPSNNQTACPPECNLGCLPDNVTCISPPNDLCANVTCKDKCRDESKLDTNGECDPNMGNCVYRTNICPFGCENDSCRIAPTCQATCPFGCEPGTSVCRIVICPANCKYGCVAGTIQCSPQPPSSGIKNGDFEDGYAGWNATGNAFGSAPSDGDLANLQGLYLNVPYSGYSGSHFASSYLPNMDKGAMGTLKSEEFFINKDYLEFLVIGQLSDQIYVDLVVNNTVIHHLGPDNPFSPFRRIVWNVSDYQGKKGTINVVDVSNRNYIEVDDFRFVDTLPPNPGEPYVDEFRNFSIIAPLNWIIEEGSVQGEISIFGATEGNFTTQIIVLTDNAEANETTEIYFAKSKTGLGMLLQNYTEISENDTMIQNINAKQIDYSYVSMNMKVRSRQVFFVHNKTRYSLTATAAEQAFDKYLKQFNDSINSFRP